MQLKIEAVQQALKRLHRSVIRPGPNVRTSLLTATAEENLKNSELMALGHSYKRRPIHPLIVRRLKEPEGKVTHEAVDGNRRLIAGGLVDIEWYDTIEIEGEISPSEISVWQTVSAIHRETLNGYELWQAAEALLGANKWSQKQLAAELGVSEPTVSIYLSPRRNLPEFQELLRQGQITLSQTAHLGRFSLEEQRAILAEGVEKLSKSNLAERARTARNGAGGKPPARQSRLAFALSAGRSVTIAGPAMTLADTIDTVSELLKHMKKAEAEGIDGRTFAQICRDKAQGNGAA